MTKLQKANIIYNNLVSTFDKFGLDIRGAGIAAAVKGTIHGSLEKIKQIEDKTTNQ